MCKPPQTTYCSVINIVFPLLCSFYPSPFFYLILPFIFLFFVASETDSEEIWKNLPFKESIAIESTSGHKESQECSHKTEAGSLRSKDFSQHLATTFPAPPPPPANIPELWWLKSNLLSKQVPQNCLCAYVPVYFNHTLTIPS